MSLFKKQNNKKEKKIVYVFVDASNVWSVVKSLKKFIKYENLKNYFKKKFNSKKIRVFYYDAYPKEGTREYDLSKKHKFFTFLKKGLGFEVIKKPLKSIKIIESGINERTEEKGNMDVEITIDAMHNKDKYDIAVFFTGDCDFLVLVNYLKKYNKEVYIFSSKYSISHELKTSGSNYTDLRDVDELIGKDLKHRKV